MAWGDVEPVPWGAAPPREMRRRFGHTVGIAVMAEDLPEDVNRVELDPAATDSNGIPAPRVTYRRRREHAAACSTTALRAARQVLEAAGRDRGAGQRRIGNFAH